MPRRREPPQHVRKRNSSGGDKPPLRRKRSSTPVGAKVNRRFHTASAFIVFVFVFVIVFVFVFHDMQLTMPSEPAMAVSTARAILMILFQLICFDILVLVFEFLTEEQVEF